jgi:hypothetical protein
LLLNDNLGGSGSVADKVEVPANGSRARAVLTVSTRPGDNYRVIASTSSAWASKIKAEDPSFEGAVGRIDGAPLTQADHATISELLTVWRTLHMEVDSMRESPTSPTDPAYGERNFVRGEIALIPRVHGRRLPTQLFLLPEFTPEHPVDLTDASEHLPNGDGRFANGQICLGLGAAPDEHWPDCTGPIRIAGLQGNGPNYVAHTIGFSIPFELTSGTAPPLRGTIQGWNQAQREFTLSSPTQGRSFEGGTLIVGGVQWTVARTQGARLTVVENRSLPFVLVDDDRVGLCQGGV